MIVERIPQGPATWQSEFGPLWVGKNADDQPVLVRSLAGAPGLLKLGAHLRHASRAEHPRLRPPFHWWKTESDTFIAHRLPEGVPLALGEFAPLTFAQALLAITPLALAMRDAHRKGILHGALSPWSLFFDPHRCEITALDLGTYAFGGARTSPFLPPEARSPQAQLTIEADIYLLARTLIGLTLPDESLRTPPNLQTIPAFAIPTLLASLDESPQKRPATVEEFLSGLAFAPSRPLRKAAEITQDANIFGRARDIEVFEHPSRGQGIRFRLFPEGGDESLAVFLYQSQAPHWYQDLERLWDNAEIRLLHAQRIEDSRGRVFLTFQPQTLLVIEPHWPVSVSDILKAQGCPSRVMVDRRDPGSFSYHLPFGNLVHQFFEDLIADETISFQDTLNKRLPPLFLDFLAAGIDDGKLESLLVESENHFQNLRRFAARRTRSGDHQDRVGWCGEFAEATRYSSRYGLEGRTDLVVTDKAEGLQIIELKSGKSWHDHPGQVQSYALLWEEVARSEELEASGFLLYSKSGRMTPVPLDENQDHATLLHGRNGLINLYHSLIDLEHDHRPPFFMQEPALCREGACRFRKERCKFQTSLLGLNPDFPRSDHWQGIDAELVDRSRLYHRHLTALIERERWEDHRALGSILSPTRLEERLLEGTAVTNLSLQPDDDPRQVRLCGDHLEVFSPGDRLLLHHDLIDRSQVFRATVVDDQSDCGPGELLVFVSTGIAGAPNRPKSWTADILPARIGYRTAHRALYRLLDEHRFEILDILLRPVRHRHEQESLATSGAPSRLHPATESTLNNSQLEALREALSNTPATLIQGPPGTGKTTVIAHLAMELIARDQNVLLTALTNTAVDTMLIKLLDAARHRGESYLPFLRLGSAARSPALSAALRAHGLPPDEFFSEDLARRSTSLNALARRLEQVQIVASTAHSALEHSVVQFLASRRATPFDVALIDEASQLTEPMALAPLVAARRFVLVGDHRQLPPIVTSERALSTFMEARDEAIAAPLRKAGLAGLDRSLFERLARFLAPRMLTTQYRMHTSIMAFPAERYYDGRLIAHDSVAFHRLQLPAGLPDGPLTAEAPVCFVDVRGLERGRSNEAEAEALFTIARQLLDSGSNESLGIIAPFRSQVHLLRRRFREANLLQDVMIDTVESFQGNEKDCILVSLVKTDRPGDFLSDARRFNVTLTRARKKIILFGHRECLEQDPTFPQWLKHPSTTHYSWNSHT